MKEMQLISITEFCAFHEVDASFISSLEQSGLIRIVRLDEADFIELEQLTQLEKFARLYYELDINVEGIETIYHLMERFNKMQEELQSLRNRLKFYESE